jgi:hypothetical protein
VAAGFPAVTAFTIGMLLATLLHWSRFDLGHFPFQLWLGLYVITPFLVPAVWWHNRPADPGTPEPGDVTVPDAIRWSVGLLGLGLLVTAVAGFIFPTILIAIWPWSLTPLLARVLAGWGALIGVGPLVISGERRWSAWRIGVESIGLWHIVFLVGAIFHSGDFAQGRLLNWFVVSVVAILVGIAALLVGMALWPRLNTPAPTTGA